MDVLRDWLADGGDSGDALFRQFTLLTLKGKVDTKEVLGELSAISREAKSEKSSKGGKKKRKNRRKNNADANNNPAAGAAKNDLIYTYDVHSSTTAFAVVREAVLTARASAGEAWFKAAGKSIEAQRQACTDLENDETTTEATPVQMSQLSSVGLRGMLAVIVELASTNMDIASRLLANMVQVISGADPCSFEGEDETLMRDLRSAFEQTARVQPALSGLAFAGVLSLAAARGNVDEILQCILSLIRAQETATSTLINVPRNVRRLHEGLMQDIFPNRAQSWLKMAPNPSTQVDMIETTAFLDESLRAALQNDVLPSIASDDSYCYLHFGCAVLKMGTGFNGSLRGHIYQFVSLPDTRLVAPWMGCLDHTLLIRHQDDEPGIFMKLNMTTLEPDGIVMQAEGEGLIGALPHALVAAADTVGVLEAAAHSWRLRRMSLDTSGSTLYTTSTQMLSQTYNKYSVHGQTCIGNAQQEPLAVTMDFVPRDVVINESFAVALSDEGNLFVAGSLVEALGVAVEDGKTWYPIAMEEPLQAVTAAHRGERVACLSESGCVYLLGQLPLETELKYKHATPMPRLYYRPPEGLRVTHMVLTLDGGLYVALSNNVILHVRQHEDPLILQRRPDGSLLNPANSWVKRGNTGKFYCGRPLKQCACGSCDGRCGPNNGCNCRSCQTVDDLVKRQAWYSNRVTMPAVSEADSEVTPELDQTILLGHLTKAAKSTRGRGPTCRECGTLSEKEASYASLDQSLYRKLRWCEKCVAAKKISDLGLHISLVICEDRVLAQEGIGAMAALDDRLVVTSASSGTLLDSSSQVNSENGVVRVSSAAGTTAQARVCEHDFQVHKARVCTLCLNCTQSGSSCYRHTAANRQPGDLCGCGNGDAGCIKCGACRACCQGADDDDKAVADDKESVLSKVASFGARQHLEVVTLLAGAHVTELAAGSDHVLALTKDGLVFGSGNNTSGQLGVGHDIVTAAAYVPLGLEGVRTLAAGPKTSLALVGSQLFCFGETKNGGLAPFVAESEGRSLWDPQPSAPLAAVPSRLTLNRGCTLMVEGRQLVKDEALLQSSVAIFDDVLAIFYNNDDGQTYELAFNLNTGNVAFHQKVSDGRLSLTQCFPFKALLETNPAGDVRIHLTQAADRTAKAVPIVAAPEHISTGSLPLLPSRRLGHGLSPLTAVGTCLLSALASRTHGQQGQEKEKTLVSRKALSPEDFMVFERFGSEGGGWGYGGGSPDAISFTCSDEAYLCGVGLFGSQGSTFSAQFKVFPEEDTSNVLFESNFDYELGVGEKYYSYVLDEPLKLEAGPRYAVYVKIRSAASSACGSSGKSTVAIEGLTVTFQASTHCNNGTDVGSGQFPALMLVTPSQMLQTKAIANDGPELYSLPARFGRTPTMASLSSILDTLRWSYELSSSASPAADAHGGKDSLTIIALECLDLLDSTVNAHFAKDSAGCLIPEPLKAHDENLAHSIIEYRRVLQQLLQLSTHDDSALVQKARETYSKLFQIFHPTPALQQRLFAEQLGMLRKADADKASFARVVFDSMSRPTFPTHRLFPSADTSLKEGAAVQNAPVVTPVEGKEAYEKLKVSSNSPTASNLELDDASYWESNGDAGSHWIQLNLEPDVYISELVMKCFSMDSYRPSTVTVKAGDDENNLEQIVVIDCQTARQGNDIPLLQDVDESYSIVRMCIAADGINCRIAGFRIAGEVRNGSSDASAEVQLSPFAHFMQTLETLGSSGSSGPESGLGDLEQLLQSAVEFIFTTGNPGLAQSLTRLICAYLASSNVRGAHASSNPTSLGTVAAAGTEASELLLAALWNQLQANGRDVRSVLCGAVGEFCLPLLLAHVAMNTNSPKSALKVNRHALMLLELLHAEMGQADTSEAATPQVLMAESAHPYLEGEVHMETLSFPESVAMMQLAFDPRLSLFQAEDVLTVEVAQGNADFLPFLSLKGPTVTLPDHTLLVPGSRLRLCLQSATCYQEHIDRRTNPGYFGYALRTTGLTLPVQDNVLHILERELTYLVACCARHMLLARHELPTTVDARDESVDINALAAQKASQAALFRMGLEVDASSVTKFLETQTLQVNGDSQIQQFLRDFVDCTPKSSGARLARWLRAGPAIDAAQCSRQDHANFGDQAGSTSVTTAESKVVRFRSPVDFIVHTRDQHGELLHHPLTRVGVHIVYPDASEAEQEGGQTLSEIVDSTAPVTKDGCCYKNIFSHLSFSPEEARLQHMMSGELLASAELLEEAKYQVKFVPRHLGTCLVHVTVDGTDIEGSPFCYKVEPNREMIMVSAEDAVADRTDDPEYANEVSMKPTASKYRVVRPVTIYAGANDEALELGTLIKGFKLEAIKICSNEQGNWIQLNMSAVRKFVSEEMHHLEAWVPEMQRGVAGDAIFLTEAHDDDADDVITEVEDMMMAEPDKEPLSPGFGFAAANNGIRNPFGPDSNQAQVQPAWGAAARPGLFGAQAAAGGGGDSFGGLFGAPAAGADGALAPWPAPAPLFKDVHDEEDGGGAAGAPLGAGVISFGLPRGKDKSDKSRKPKKKSAAAAPFQFKIEAPAAVPAVGALRAVDEPAKASENAKNQDAAPSKPIQPEAMPLDPAEGKSQVAIAPMTAALERTVRAAFAAYLWHGDVTSDAMALATHLRFDPTYKRPNVKTDTRGTMGNQAFEAAAPRLDELSEDALVWVQPDDGARGTLPGFVQKVQCPVLAQKINDVELAVGQRLEAKDRLNPFMICVAFIKEILPDGKVKVSFDGWGERYDYIASLDNEDLHPIGFCQLTQHKLEKPRGFDGDLLCHASNEQLIDAKRQADDIEHAFFHPLHPHPLRQHENAFGWNCDGANQPFGMGCPGRGLFGGPPPGLRYRCMAGCDYDLCSHCMSTSIFFEREEQPVAPPVPAAPTVVVRTVDGDTLTVQMDQIRLRVPVPDAQADEHDDPLDSGDSAPEPTRASVPKYLTVLWEQMKARLEMLVKRLSAASLEDSRLQIESATYGPEDQQQFCKDVKHIISFFVDEHGHLELTSPYRALFGPAPANSVLQLKVVVKGINGAIELKFRKNQPIVVDAVKLAEERNVKLFVCKHEIVSSSRPASRLSTVGLHALFGNSSQAGNCGDGAQKASTWYLMCKSCHSNYLAAKDSKQNDGSQSKSDLPVSADDSIDQLLLRQFSYTQVLQAIEDKSRMLLAVAPENSLYATCLAERRPATLETPEPVPGHVDRTHSHQSPAATPRRAAIRRQQTVADDHPHAAAVAQRTLTADTALAGVHAAESAQPLDRDRVSEGDKAADGDLFKQSLLATARPALTRTISMPQHSEGAGAGVGPAVSRPRANDLTRGRRASQPSLLTRPSASLRSLYQGRENDELLRTMMTFWQSPVHGKNVLGHLTQTAEHMIYRLQGLRHYIVLLCNVRTMDALHQTMWTFVAALHAQGDATKQDGSLAAAPHPAGAGFGQSQLERDVAQMFYRFLLIVLDFMQTLPAASPLHELFLRCWAIQFRASDHSFLHRSHVFSHISDIMSKLHSVTSNSMAATPLDDLSVTHTGSVSLKDRVTVSSRDHMLASLTDGSTETFWEVGDDDRERTITIDCAELEPTAVAVHVDNVRDAQNAVLSLSLHTSKTAPVLGGKASSLDKSHAGWVILSVPPNLPAPPSNLVVRVGGSTKSRVRQVVVLGVPQRTSGGLPLAEQAKARGNDALALFRLLTLQLFGGGQSVGAAQPPVEGDAPAPAEADDPKQGDPKKDGDGGDQAIDTPELRQHVVGLLFDQDARLNTLQQQVCKHFFNEIGHQAEAISRAAEDAEEGVAVVNDDYLFELVNMVASLSASASGIENVARERELINDLVGLLHLSTPRVQRQVVHILCRLLQVVPPTTMATLVTRVPLASKQEGLVPLLILAVAKALTVQVRVRGGQSKVNETTTFRASVATPSDKSLYRWFTGRLEQENGTAVVMVLDQMLSGQLGVAWQENAYECLTALLDILPRFESSEDPVLAAKNLDVWLALGALACIDTKLVALLNAKVAPESDGKSFCDNHDDGETTALVKCGECQASFCADCDHVLHLSRTKRDHVRVRLTTQQAASNVELNEGTGRVRLPRLLCLTDRVSLKAVIEVKATATSGTTCRFCDSPLGPDGGLAQTMSTGIKNCCPDKDCIELARACCTKTLACGHACCGVRNEEQCLPCLHGCDNESLEHPLTQDQEDQCMICFTSSLQEEPCLRVDCGHVFHANCLKRLLEIRWNGPRITFGFCKCPICKASLLQTQQPALEELLVPLRKLHEMVRRKALMRLQYDGKAEAVGGDESTQADFAMEKYAYFPCYKCKQPYFGGDAACEAGRGAAEYDPSELICPLCVGGGAAQQICAKHGEDFLEYKCRYCCSVAVFFCFGTTHFCNTCHDDYRRCTECPKEDLPHCPCGPVLTQLEGDECPLHVKHPPTGEEFALGCGVCRNAQTF
ncbi:uncharacterized protein MONBRDRAFT_33522 [Monosiga brevicollis MX1]|uniref:RCR-type E3 ubiquitin transferase n=1 Tax=Monosiga brevicollis TaxID=81824 RepID=A9V5V6_MONBE|nr:uncharacterized protein MONBRDRAFT_33522 [Monosiga brevicollis MX1]EDQ87112.1 predicted protein [Monosiga brevicollis MX1]|eukprot:XP_001748055.1 hypothetical protein [Monosiga brevicollis MX1]